MEYSVKNTYIKWGGLIFQTFLIEINTLVAFFSMIFYTRWKDELESAPIKWSGTYQIGIYK